MGNYGTLLHNILLHTEAISIVATIASVISAISAWRNTRTARNNLRMARIEFEERHDSIHAHLIDGVSWDSSTGDRVVSFACTYSNAANAPNTLKSIELWVHAINQNGTKIVVVLDKLFGNEIPFKDFTLLNVPLNMQARSTASGWISFSLPKYLLDTKRIDKYEINANSSGGKVISIDCHLLKRMRNENWENREN